MSALDITTISTVASTVAIVMSGFLWLGGKIFNLGKISQRLDSVESDVHDLRSDLRTGLSNVSQRIDKLILTIAESKQK
jgi:hypothetical protein